MRKGQKFSVKMCLLCATLLISDVVSAADLEPLWEAGAGISVLTLPAYRGSDRINNFVLPIPYLTYHGDILKADRKGVRGEFFDNDRVEITLSASASPPVKSNDLAARNNMPNLQPTVELGPEIDFRLWRNSSNTSVLRLRLPLREAFTVAGSMRDVGVIFSPNLNADFINIPHMHGWAVGLVTGPIFANSRQNDYFYGVAQQYATPTRPAYTAKGGYVGAQFLASISHRFANVWLGGFVRYDTLNGAVVIDSPLVFERHYASAGIAVSWILGRSDSLVITGD